VFCHLLLFLIAATKSEHAAENMPNKNWEMQNAFGQSINKPVNRKAKATMMI
jgi:hypothetical protein